MPFPWKRTLSIMRGPKMYKWNEKAKRYQWFNGKAYFVSRDTVLAWADTSISKTGAIADTLASLVSSGNISPADWYGMMQRHIKDEVIRQYVTGIGGRSQMTPSDWGSVGATVKDQYNYLKGFYETLKDGNLTEGRSGQGPECISIRPARPLKKRLEKSLKSGGRMR